MNNIIKYQNFDDVLSLHPSSTGTEELLHSLVDILYFMTLILRHCIVCVT